MGWQGYVPGKKGGGGERQIYWDLREHVLREGGGTSS